MIDDREGEVTILQDTNTGLYHLRLINLLNGEVRITDEGFATIEEARRALDEWLNANGVEVIGQMQ